MKRPSFARVPGRELLSRLEVVVARERETTVEMVVLISEIDRRRLFAGESFRSMFQYCVRKLHMSEDEAYKRIRVARTVRRRPEILDMIADGRLHLTAVVMLSPWLRMPGGSELLAEAAHRSNAQIRELIAARFPQPDIPALVRPLAPSTCDGQLVPEPVAQPAPLSPARAEAPPPAPVAPASCGTPAGMAAPPARVAPIAPARYAVQFTCTRAVQEKLEYARALLGHSVPSGDLPEVFERALDALIEKLERRKFARTSRESSMAGHGKAGARSIPSGVRREVWERDAGRCTFQSGSGERCDSRTRLEFDHIRPVSSGGASTVANLRLRCRTHNQYEAEQLYGAEFMELKRQQARRRSSAAAPA